MAGSLVGSERMKQEGEAKQHMASAENEAAKAEGRQEALKERVTGMGEEMKGKLTGDTGERLEGKYQQTKGSAREELNK